MRIEISGDTATVYADSIRRPTIAARLIDAAGPGRAGVVRTVTGGQSLALSVPVDVARAAGLLPDKLDTSELAVTKADPKAGANEQAGANPGAAESKPAPKPEPKTTAKPRTRKTGESADAE